MYFNSGHLAGDCPLIAGQVHFQDFSPMSLTFLSGSGFAIAKNE
jgi:hypothetical protein